MAPITLVCHTDAAALGPVSRLRPSRYKVTALSDVRYLMIEQSLLDRFVEHVPVGGVLVEEALMVASEPNELIDDSATHPLMFDVFDDLNHGRWWCRRTRRSRSVSAAPCMLRAATRPVSPTRWSCARPLP